MRMPKFLSTPSARRATIWAMKALANTMISIHALREEGDFVFSLYYVFAIISIHALREEGDPFMPAKTYKVPISIHALREEGD